MKKPSLKREKKPAPHELVAASPFDPVPVKESRLKRKKAAAQAAGTSQPAAARAGAPAGQPTPAKGRRVGGVGRALRKPFVLLGAPFRKLGSLKGRTRVVVFGLIAIIVAIGAVKLRGGTDDAKLVRQTLERYATASRNKDYQTLCDDLFASSYVKQTASTGLPCEVALRTALEDVHDPTLKVLSVDVNGDHAAARVTGSAAGQVPGAAVYTLVRENGSWKILPPRPTTATAP